MKNYTLRNFKNLQRLGTITTVGLALWTGAPRAETKELPPVGICLALITDTSGSVTGEKDKIPNANYDTSEDKKDGPLANEYGLQRDGTARALTSPKVKQAIVEGGGALVAYIEFSEKPVVVLSFRELRTAADIDDMGRQIMGIHRTMAGKTGLAFAELLGVKELTTRCPSDVRKIIDISGDGANNIYDVSSVAARDAAFQAGVVINGLPIINPSPTYGEHDVVQTYEKEVVTPGGKTAKGEELQPGFVIEATGGFEGFEEAMTRKLELEVAGKNPETSLAQAMQQHPIADSRIALALTTLSR